MNKSLLIRREIIEETHIDASGNAKVVTKIVSKDKNGNTIVGRNKKIYHKG